MNMDLLLRLPLKIRFKEKAIKVFTHKIYIKSSLIKREQGGLLKKRGIQGRFVNLKHCLGFYQVRNQGSPTNTDPQPGVYLSIL